MTLRPLPLAVLVVSVACASASAADTDSLTPLTRLPAGVTVRVEADSLAGLKALVRPRATWDGKDMLWVGHDTKGSLYFTVDRAFAIRAADGSVHAALLRVPADAEIGTALDGQFLRESTPLCRGKDDAFGRATAFRLSRDNELGTVYQVNWRPRVEDGQNLCQGVSVLLLCDAAGRWSLVGTGPGLRGTWGHGQSRGCTQTAAYSVRWTGDAAAPAVVTVTATTACYGSEPDAFSDQPLVTLRRDGVVGGETTGVEWQGPSYVQAAPGETLGSVARRLAVWNDNALTDVDAARKQTARFTLTQLYKLNPRLPDGPLAAGTRVNVPDTQDSVNEIQAADVR